jgi:hypothetical protein
MVIAMALGTALLRSVLVHRQQSQRYVWQQQSLWLAESGYQRAVCRLRESSDYVGEIWMVPASTIGADAQGVVTIEVQSREGSRYVVVEAGYPEDPQHRSTCRREIRLPRPAEEPLPNNEQDSSP